MRFVIPRELKPGIFVHIHDIFLPEQYLLAGTAALFGCEPRTLTSFVKPMLPAPKPPFGEQRPTCECASIPDDRVLCGARSYWNEFRCS
jgi:hypothetical protein